jgi:hypothetical protein
VLPNTFTGVHRDKIVSLAARHQCRDCDFAGTAAYVSIPYWAKGGPPKMSGFVTNATSEDVFSPAA